MFSRGKNTEGVYVSIDMLLDLRHQIEAERRLGLKRAQRGLPGEVLSMHKGPGIEFEDIRPYLPGDDLRHVDWRVTARTGRPYTRRYTEDHEHSTLVVVDQRVNMFFGSGDYFKSYSAALSAARVAWYAADNRHRLGAVIASDAIDIVPLGHPKRSILELCKKLHACNNSLNINSSGQTGLVDVIERVSLQLQPGMRVTVISDFSDLTEHVVTMLGTIVKNCSLELVQIFDPLEENIPGNATVTVSNGLKISRAVLNKKARELYRSKRAEINRQLQQAASLPGVVLLRRPADSVV